MVVNVNQGNNHMIMKTIWTSHDMMSSFLTDNVFTLSSQAEYSSSVLPLDNPKLRVSTNVFILQTK